LRALGRSAHLSIARIARDVPQALGRVTAYDGRAADFAGVAGRIRRAGYRGTRSTVVGTGDVRDERIAGITRWVRFAVRTG
jgi:hypothetical protein